MALNYWLGGDAGNENDWNTAANWSTAAVPVNTDDVHITGQRGGSYHIDGASVTNIPNTIYIDSEYTKDIGSTGTSITFGPGAGQTCDVLDHRGSGTVYFDAGTNATITNTTLKSPEPRRMSMYMTDSGGTLVNARILRGGLTLTGTGTIAATYLAHTSNREGDSLFVMESAASCPLLYQSGGHSTVQGTLTAWVLHGVCLIETGNATVVAAGRSSRVIFNSSGGILTGAQGFNDAVIDLSQTTVSRTVSSSQMVGGAKLLVGNATNAITFTLNPTVTGFTSDVVHAFTLTTEQYR